MDRNNRVSKELDEDNGNDDELRIKKYRVRDFTFFFLPYKVIIHLVRLHAEFPNIHVRIRS